MTLRQLSEMKRALAIRSRTLQVIRKFFCDRGFIDVETPVRIKAPALELHIDVQSSEEEYLRTSPELHMKRMLAAGYDKVFQIGPCFRRKERGQLHNPEFTMLEWYRVGAGYIDILADTKALIAEVVKDIHGGATIDYRGTKIDVMPVWDRLTVQEAFTLYAGWDPVKNFDDARFTLDLVDKVEPRFPANRPMVLMDYPAKVAALSRCKKDHPELAERWELYIGGIEIANAFGELTDEAEQRRRFKECATERSKTGKEVYPLDEEFLAALKQGLPECSGIALGIDRLVMLLANCETIAGVRPFCD
jgi:elongation factor P--(R)-beta-lysine ligase